MGKESHQRLKRSDSVSTRMEPESEQLCSRQAEGQALMDCPSGWPQEYPRGVEPLFHGRRMNAPCAKLRSEMLNWSG